MKIICQICNKQFNRYHGLHRHIFLVHKNMSMQDYYDKYLLKKSKKCPFCNKNKIFISIGIGYHTTCGNKECVKKQKVKSIKHTCLKLYKCTNVAKIPEVRKMLSDSASNPETIKKRKKTKKKRYKDENYNNMEKNLNTRAKNSGSVEESYKQGMIIQKNTNFKKYKVENYFQADEFKEQAKETKQKRYGDPNYNNWESVWKDTENRNNTLQKVNDTKRKNKTFNTSKPEKILYDLLCIRFDKDDIIRQYWNELYPFSCDFYIKSEDLYIELNNHWTHGDEPFNKRKKSHKEKIKIWYERSKEINVKGNLKKFYNNAIYVWTDLDVKKRNIAKKNNLNYLEIFNINNLEEIIKNIV